jgi:hypothetical protein
MPGPPTVINLFYVDDAMPTLQIMDYDISVKVIKEKKDMSIIRNVFVGCRIGTCSLI